MTHHDIAIHLQQIYPDTKGLSERSVRRYCGNQNITRMTDDELDGIVEDFVTRYGHGYGRSMMQGSIRAAIGITVGIMSQRHVSNSLRRVAPVEFEQQTRDLLERTNPIPYYAPYFGYKVHMDQNEKIGQSIGCTHVALIDGCSRMIVGYASMPIKNPILIYEFAFRPALLEYGLWNQLRVDHGQEFVLCLFVQDLLKSYRFCQDKTPWRQTTSTENNTIERFWPELNSRVNYPIKRAFNSIRGNFDYDLANPTMKFTFSWVARYIAADAADHLIKSRNFHRVEGRNGCIPIENMRATKLSFLWFLQSLRLYVCTRNVEETYLEMLSLEEIL